MTIGQEVRLKSAYIVKGESIVKDDAGNITEIHCTYDPGSRSGSGTEASMRKVKGTLHWVSVKHAIKAEVREYDRLFLDEAPDQHVDKDLMEFINPESLKIIKEAYVEPFLKDAKLNDKLQFQRLGYFTLDKDSTADHLIFNKTVALRDTWAKQQQPQQEQQKNQQPTQKGQPQRSAISEIQKISKKYTNLSGAKLEQAKASIVNLAESVSYEELEPLFNTSAKKTGTRIGVMIALGVLKNKGLVRTSEMETFINSCLEDSNELLREEARAIKQLMK